MECIQTLNYNAVHLGHIIKTKQKPNTAKVRLRVEKSVTREKGPPQTLPV